MKFTLAKFATKSVTATYLFPLFWKHVGILEEKYQLKVMAITSDGASANRTMHSMNKDMKHYAVANYEEKNIMYKTKNQFVEDNRDIHFICDQPHFVKTVGNDLAHSGFDKTFPCIL